MVVSPCECVFLEPRSPPRVTMNDWQGPPHTQGATHINSWRDTHTREFSLMKSSVRSRFATHVPLSQRWLINCGFWGWNIFHSRPWSWGYILKCIAFDGFQLRYFLYNLYTLPYYNRMGAKIARGRVWCEWRIMKPNIIRAYFFTLIVLRNHQHIHVCICILSLLDTARALVV